MNLVEHTVVEINSEPYFNRLWCVDVIVSVYGNRMPTTIHFRTEEEAKAVSVGYTFEG